MKPNTSQNLNEKAAKAGTLINKTAIGKDFDGSMESEFTKDNSRDRRGKLSIWKRTNLHVVPTETCTIIVYDTSVRRICTIPGKGVPILFSCIRNCPLYDV